MKLSKSAFSEIEKKLAKEFPKFDGTSRDLNVWEYFCKSAHIEFTDGSRFIRIFGDHKGYATSAPNPIDVWKLYSYEQ